MATNQEILEQLRIEKEKYELDNLKIAADKRHQEEVEKARRAKQMAIDEKSSRELELMRQGACTHRKGGKNLEGLLNGNDANYSVAKNTYPDGVTKVLCTRCNKEWGPGDKDYVEALRFPTDNEPSSSITFSNLRKAG